MKKLLFFSILFFVSCTRYVHIVIETKGNISLAEPMPKQILQIPFKGDDMPFGDVQIPNDFTLPYRPLPNVIIGSKIYKDSIVYYRIVDSMFFAPPASGIMFVGNDTPTDSIIQSGSIIRRISKH